jgi:Flp pilus assembly protein TadG
MLLMVRLRRHERGRLAGERGQALVEFALLLPLLLVVVLGVVDLGKAFGYKNDMTHLANAAARFAAVNSSPTGPGANSIANYVKSTAPNDLQNVGGSVTPVQITFSFPNPVPPATKNHCTGDPVKVTVTSHYTWLPFLTLHGALPSIGADMTSSATMRLEKDYKDDGGNTDAYTGTNPVGGAC